MAIIRYRDGHGNIRELLAFRGPQGEQGIPGQQGIQGIPGQQGDPGITGYTPIRGTDYWTNEDKETIINAVLEALPTAEEVSF